MRIAQHWYKLVGPERIQISYKKDLSFGNEANIGFNLVSRKATRPSRTPN